jgi:hypothetical protein
VVLVSVPVQDEDGSGDLLFSVLSPLSQELRKQLIKFAGSLRLGREWGCLLCNCFKCLYCVQTVSVSLALLQTLSK